MVDNTLVRWLGAPPPPPPPPADGGMYDAGPIADADPVEKDGGTYVEVGPEPADAGSADTTPALDTAIAPDTAVVPDTAIAPDTAIGPDTAVAPDTAIAPDSAVVPDTTPEQDAITTRDSTTDADDGATTDSSSGCSAPREHDRPGFPTFAGLAVVALGVARRRAARAREGRRGR